MKIYPKTVLKHPSGKELQNVTRDPATNEPKMAPMTLADVCVESLCNPAKGDPQIAGVQHMIRWMLAQKVMKVDDDGAVDVDTAEVQLIKTRIEKYYEAPMIVGQAWMLIEPPADLKAVPRLGE